MTRLAPAGPTDPFEHALPRDDTIDVLRLPDPPIRPRRVGIPVVASVIPVLAATGLWLMTGAITMLWFAALGPLIALGSLADAARTARRDRRQAERAAELARDRVRAAIRTRHADERTRRWARHPDVLHLFSGHDGPDDVWRPVTGRGDQLVVGRGRGTSAIRVAGGGDDAAVIDLRRTAMVLDDVPRTVPAADGVAVIGPPGPASAVVRALALQLCLSLSPEELRVAAPDPGRSDEAWLAALPHVAAARGRALALVGPGQTVPPESDIVIARLRPGDPAPPRCRAVLTMTGLDRARLDRDGRSEEVVVEAVSSTQAEHIARALQERAARVYPSAVHRGPIALADLLAAPLPQGEGLAVPIGQEGDRPFLVDLIADGPHALVAGITGSGKSELLTTWVTALSARYSSAQVAFLLADFKGGTAFEPLAVLPHVTGVITDLDAGGAGRALQSLRAELRRREAEIVGAGARDIDGTGMPRLVVVVDEFAALHAGHPELSDLFTDIAARGRALGVHLILGTQRAGGFRDALLANCPLRMSLRVADAADSRLLLGVDDAAHLSGAADARGIALVRRAADDAPRTVRIALTTGEAVARAASTATGPAPRRPWLPPLPERLMLDDALAASTGRGLVLGIADQPDQQRQSPVVLPPGERGVLVLGRAGSGRTSTLATLAAQARRRVWVPSHPEQAWDAVAELVEMPPRHGTLVLVDDVDAVLARFPADYAQAFSERLEQVIHAASGEAQVIISAQRLSGAVGRMADLLPRRVLLAPASRADVVAAGGAPDGFTENMPPGRALVDGALVQVALAPASMPGVVPDVPEWDPRDRMTAAVARSGAAVDRVRRAAAQAGTSTLTVEEALRERDAGRPLARGTVVIGDAEQWQRAWRLWHELRSAHDVLIDTDSAADYRLLTGDRSLPPYCLGGRGRAWLMHAGGAPARVGVAGAPRR